MPIHLASNLPLNTFRDDLVAGLQLALALLLTLRLRHRRLRAICRLCDCLRRQHGGKSQNNQCSR